MDARDTAIHIRAPKRTKDLIEAAASSLGKSLSEFTLESARSRAVDVLLDQRIFHLDSDASEAFARMLENPPAPVPALRKLMASKAPWE